jgi:hypothetical protein
MRRVHPGDDPGGTVLALTGVTEAD